MASSIKELIEEQRRADYQAGYQAGFQAAMAEVEAAYGRTGTPSAARPAPSAVRSSAKRVRPGTKLSAKFDAIANVLRERPGLHFRDLNRAVPDAAKSVYAMVERGMVRKDADGRFFPVD